MKYELFVSEVVLDEARAGDADEVTKRLVALAGLPLLDITPGATKLANQLLTNGILPPKAGRDALHISLATVHGIDYLLTWNCRHIANAHVRKMIGKSFQAAGYDPPVICTPEELGESK